MTCIHRNQFRSVKLPWWWLGAARPSNPTKVSAHTQLVTAVTLVAGIKLAEIALGAPMDCG